MKRIKSIKEKKKDSLYGYAFISPFFILFSIFGLFPIIFSFYLSFQRWNGLGEMEFVGLRNFELVLADPFFWKAMYNTFVIALMSTLPQLIIAFLLAFALNSTYVKMKGFFRVSFFLPNVTSIVAVAVVFGTLFTNSSTGLVNSFIGLFGFEPVNWGTSEWGVKWAISAMIFWRWVGYNTIIYLAGLQSISQDLYEAAKIDGASVRQQIMHITIPMMKPVIIFTVFISTIGSLQLFTEPLVFIGTTLREEGVTVVLYLYREAFSNNAFGTASATAVILFFVIIVMSVTNLLIANRLGNSRKKVS
ncbi:cytochrome c biogenesis protein [Halolactibacillus alkaliphilus]|uniref:Cytochrome c biogenesis protein n=1 Tax=Halolactibacillus alkaliphilus TaxID=442899 RepID=A0A511WZU7_9BACI|nr:sugar ABC transporter permease [Halolactibacillus alkaliphilus]GEN56201.1 cytochrome c biogenesis protein [Halolactibacillus alkaliphilus]GGN66598.1 cytochrome c biogenesis protein [Halolactibacillus alkaliphilus]SFO67975.1 carbohydrate ABC transporter membrane protein 1, CUT1 family (TC 3.A.1.1.-) [Halolactibacillus alkaliphilus]